jgi:amino acid adenylation domain-containing protein
MIYLLPHLLINAAKQTPEKVAVVYGKSQITYKELDDLTNKAARFLQERGVKKGDRVGIYVHKSIPTVISIYAILKAGAVYVPLDPNAPVSRLSYIIDNCEIKCLLTATGKQEKIKEILTQTQALKHVIYTDNDNDISELDEAMQYEWKSIDQYSDQLLDNTSIGGDLAYIIYTSGSTGNPKGVMITHQNALTFINWAFEAIGVSSEDHFSSHAPIHFDLSIFDLYVCCKAGATLFPVPETLSMFPARLTKWIVDHKISVWYSVPSILSMMVVRGQLAERDFSALRAVVFAGEVFPTKYLRELMQLVPGPEYYNLYGPTETNVITYYQVPEIPIEQTAPIPIGICCESMDVFVVDQDGNLVTEPGEEGELLARGTCVAKGYWGDEKKTSRVFINNPLQENFQETVYRTGDLVTLDEDGNYLYKGRIDHMIKSRGYRIEIGEIESALYAHPIIKEVAVIAIPDDLITNRIKAVIVATDHLTPVELRAYCSEKMPKYMIPEIIEFTASLPKTSTGKTDKQSLLQASMKGVINS